MAQQYAVDVVVKTVGIANIQRLEKGLKGIGPSARVATRQINGVSRAVRGLGQVIATAALGDQLRRSFGAAAELSGTQQRVKALTAEFKEYVGIQAVAAKAAQKFQVANAQALSDFTDLGNRLAGTGTTLKDLENIYEGFNTLVVNNAVGAQQAASAQLQLNQALGSGRLAGEEFNSINEATPQLLTEVARVMGVARGELKELAADGKITSDILIKALTNIKEKGASQLKDSFNTAAGDLRKFDKAVSDLQVAIGQELLPVFTPLLQTVTAIAKGFGSLPGPIKTATVSVVALTVAVGALNVALGAVGLSGIGGAFAAIGSAATGLATTLGVVGAKALALSQGKAVLAGAITAANTKITLMTVGLGALKVAMLALPWVAVAAGVAALGKMTFDYYKKQADLNRLLTDSTVKSTELKDAVAAKKEELEKASGKLDKLRESSTSSKRALEAQRKKVEELKRQLEALEGTYNVRVNLEIVASQIAADVEAKAAAAGGSAKGFDTLDQAGIREAIARANGTYKDPNADSDGGSSGGGGGRQSQVPQLQQELDLSNKLLENDRQRLQAQFDNNTALVEKLAQDRIELELAGQKAAIALEDIPAAEKKLKIALAENEATLQTLELKNQIAEAEQRRQEALGNVLQPIEDEIELLQAKLNGNEDEIKQLQEIRRLKQQIADIDPNADTSGVEAMVKQRDELRKNVEQSEELKSQYKSLASGIASDFTNAFKSIIDGSKSADEAFADMLKSMANRFLDMAMKILQDAITQQLMSLFGSLFGGFGGGTTIGSGTGAPVPGATAPNGQPYFGPAFSTGGRPNIGQYSLVGETGPELVRFDSAATVEPASAFGAATEAMKSSMSKSSSAAERQQDAEAFASVVNNAEPIDVRYDSTVINNVSYVTEEQMVAANREAVKEARARVFSDMRNKPSTRQRMGLS